MDEDEENLSSPTLVLIDPVTDELYLISNSRVLIYSPDLFPVFTLGKNRGIITPQGLAVDREGNLYVSQAPLSGDSRYRISFFNACLRWEKDIYIEDIGLSPEPFTPGRLAVDSKGIIYVAGSYYPGIVAINRNGDILDIIAPEENGTRATINDVTVDRSDRLYLVSADAGRVFVYDQDRNFLFKFGTKGGVFTKLARAMAVDMDAKSERFYVVDYMRHSILAYDAKGDFLFEFGGLGTEENWYQYPIDVAVDVKGRIFIADTFNNRVQVLIPTSD